ncbi:MAG: S8 family serine peptidase [Cyclobacteriaceae bacterium]
MILHFYGVFKLKSFLLVILIGITTSVIAQQKYWVHGVNHEFNKSMSIEPEFCSAWLKSCTYYLRSDQADSLKKQGFDLSTVASFSVQGIKEAPRVSFALEQIEAELLIQKGVTGKGVTIGIIDGGFLRADEDDRLSHVFDQNNVLWYKDYVTPNMEVYGGSIGLDDNHGTEVWQNIAGYDSEKDIRYGLATDAKYLLARTDHGGYEKRLEEDYLIAALEAMTEKGAQVINISLGYSTGYLEASENYKPEDMDGKTTMVARAIDYASYEKGVLVVVAAGNEGLDSKWQIVSSPGDAKGALTVGAVKFKIWDKMNYSSIGPEFLPYMKPNVSVYASSGTSYATPVITGLAACILSMDSTLSNFEIIGILEKSSHLYPFGNNYLGYGVPRVSRILQILEGKSAEIPVVKSVRVKKSFFKLKDKIMGKTLVLYHKKDERNVIARFNHRPIKNKFKVKRYQNAVQTTILIENRAIEIIWN